MKKLDKALDFLETETKSQSPAEHEAFVSAAFVVARAFLANQERQAAALENIAAQLNELTKPEPEDVPPVAVDGSAVKFDAER